MATTIGALAATAAPADAHVPYVLGAWGSNLRGQLGISSELGPERCSVFQVPCATSAMQVSGLSGLIAISGGEEHSLALLEGGVARAWGDNEHGQLGDGRCCSEQPESNVPVDVNALTGQTAIAGGGSYGMARSSTGTVSDWGDNESGQLGYGFAGPNWKRTSPVEAPGASGASAIAAGEEHSLALLPNNGEVHAWGNNESGQVGNGTTAELEKGSGTAVLLRRKPTILRLSSVTAIAAGGHHSLALVSGGSLVAWGANDHGQLGDNTNTGPQTCEAGPCSTLAVWVQGGSGRVVAIAAGGNHSLALLEDGTVMAWGENGSGQLGDGTTVDKYTMVPVVGLSNVVAIAAGEEHSLALLSNGTVMAWGANGEGQLGTGTPTGPDTCGPTKEACSRTPVPVTGLSYMDVKGIAAGGWHSLAFGPPNPTVTSVSPKGGLELGGTAVTVTGTEFTGATAVKFGSVDALAYTVESPTSITAVSPKGTGTVDVTVATAEGTSPTSSADRFTYTPPSGGAPPASQASSRPAPSAQTSSPVAAPAQPAPASSSAGFEPRIIGVNLHVADLLEDPQEHWKTIPEGSVKSIRAETSTFAQQMLEKSEAAFAGTKSFAHMACIVGNGADPAFVQWREGGGGLEPTLKAAMYKIGNGNEGAGQARWEQETLQEVERCAKPSVAVIEVINEPWVLHGVGTAPPTPSGGGSQRKNAELYGTMLRNLLIKVKGLEEKHAIAPVKLLASAPTDRTGKRWLKPMLKAGEAAGAPTLRELLGGLVFHPYGQPSLTAPAVLGMRKQQEFAGLYVYVTEYGVKAAGGGSAQAAETDKMFHLLKGAEFSWVKGIWYYDFAEAQQGYGWYARSGTEWSAAREVKHVVECFAEEEAGGPRCP